MEKDRVVENIILMVRGEKVILDSDLAKHYEVPINRLKEQVKRNRAHFPKDHMFQLKTKEKAKVSEIYDHLSDLKDSKTRPYAFTQQGAIMAARILNKMRTS
jgi:hypothetical protein